MSLSVGITCYPTFGGSGIVATEIGLALARRGHRVHFIATDVPVRLDHFEDNVLFHEVEAGEYPLFPHGSYALTLASKIVEVASWERLDVLHVHYAIPHATSAYLAREILGARAPRLVTTLHGTDITLVGSEPSYLPITRFSIEKSDAITAPSRFLRQATYDQLGVAPSVPIEVIPNFVDPARLRPAASRSWAPLAPLFPRQAGPARVLLHSSNFRPLKRVGDTLRILAAVRREVPAVLVLVGDGPERSRVEALARELDLGAAVAFLGKQLDFVSVLQQADVFLLPSETESFGLAALEALACGVPVVASRVGGLPEVIEDGVSGSLCPPGDVAAMAARVLALLGDPAAWSRASAAARARAETSFPMAPMIDRYEACYRRLLGLTSSPRAPS